VKLLLEMNLSPLLAKALKELNHDAIHWSNVGDVAAKDEDVLLYAADNNCVLLSCDLDFGVILSVTHGDKPSVVQLRLQSIDPQGDAGLISAAIQENADALDQGAILTLNTITARTRLLPLP
jgi:predicted nuclease of predicted toxin-antitoxin system